jgi:HD-GYP domain-containing protein (c-di-GMP phosphodiesterase class II)
MKALVNLQNPLSADTLCLAIESFFKDVKASAAESAAEAFAFPGPGEAPDLLITDSLTDGQLTSLAQNPKIKICLIGNMEIPEKIASRSRRIPENSTVVGILNASRSLFPEWALFEIDRFCPIAVRSLLLNQGRFRPDAYLKISDRKFVKAIHQGEAFSQEDFEKYAAKNIEFLYIKSADFMVLLQSWLDELQEMRSKPLSYSLENVAQAFTYVHQTVHRMFPEEGFTPELEALTVESARLAAATAEHLPKFASLIETLSKNKVPYISGHSSATALLACKLAVMMDWKSEGTFFKLSLAAHLHDLTLERDELAMLNSRKEIELSEFSDEEKVAIYTHPRTAADLLRGESTIPADVAFIIEQHHERAYGEGFPRNSVEEISVISALFILAHDLVITIFRDGETFDLPKFFRLPANVEKFGRGNLAKVFRTIKEKVHEESAT